jgi:hypothetical protein
MESWECLAAGAACSSPRLGLSHCYWLSRQPWPIRSVPRPLQLLQPNERSDRLRRRPQPLRPVQRRRLLSRAAWWYGRRRQSPRLGRCSQGPILRRQGIGPLPGRPQRHRPRLLLRTSDSQSLRWRHRQRTREAQSQRPQNRSRASELRCLRRQDRRRASSPRSLPRLRQRRRQHQHHHRLQRRSWNRRPPAPPKFGPRIRSTAPFTATTP